MLIEYTNMVKIMEYSDFYGRTIILTKRNNLTHAEIADFIGKEKGAIFARASRNSKINDIEIEKVEDKLGIKLSDISISNNSGERREKAIDTKKSAERFGRRLFDQVQVKNNLSNREMAKLLGLYEEEYIDLAYGSKEPNMRILNNIKANFEVSIDYLLYGE